MITISISDYSKYGCIHCGSKEYERKISIDIDNSQIRCAECGAVFFIADDRLNRGLSLLGERMKPLKINAHPRKDRSRPSQELNKSIVYYKK